MPELSDLKLFRITNGSAQELKGTSMLLEVSLQRLIEGNMEALFGMRSLATEYSTGAGCPENSSGPLRVQGERVKGPDWSERTGRGEPRFSLSATTYLFGQHAPALYGSSRGVLAQVIPGRSPL